MHPQVQEIVKYLRTKRPLWKLQEEDNILTIATNQSLTEWPIFDDLVGLYKLKIRNATSINGGIVVTLILGPES